MTEPGPLETKAFEDLVDEIQGRFQGVIVMACRQLETGKRDEWEIKHRIQGGPLLVVGMLNYLNAIIGRYTQQSFATANQRPFDDTNPQAPPVSDEGLAGFIGDEAFGHATDPIDFEGDLPKTPRDFLDDLGGDDDMMDPYE